MTLGLLIGGIALALGLVLSWRFPALPMALGLLCVAVRPEMLLGGTIDQLDWGVARSLLVLGLLCNALRYGIRRQVNWPLAAFAVALVLSAALGDLHPKLTPLLMLEGTTVLALPWLFTSVVLAPGSRRNYATLIALLPLLSALVGVLVGLAEPIPTWGFQGSFDRIYRFGGAMRNAEAFALLAFAGFAVALHEATRPARPYAGWLALLNLVLVILSGTRMTIAVAALFLVIYVGLSPGLRGLLVRRRWFTGIAALALIATLVIYWPPLHQRLFAAGGEAINMSQRDNVWGFYLEEFMLSPLFGRGPGVAYVAGADWLTNLARNTPHNEYLHLLVAGGAAGFLLCMTAIVLWCRQLWVSASDNDRPFLLALAPALALQAFTLDALIYWTGLALFAYLGVMLTRPSAMTLREHARAEQPPATPMPADPAADGWQPTAAPPAPAPALPSLKPAPPRPEVRPARRTALFRPES